MENASKALIIAGGMLLVMLLVGLLAFAWNKFSDYQDSQDSLTDIEDTAKFNEQFTQYDRNDVMGYELISIANKVIDYNNNYANTTYSNNNKNYLPITLKFSLGNDTDQIKQGFTYYGDSMKLFCATSYTQSDKVNKIEGLFNDALAAEYNNNFSNSQIATNIAKNIDSIFLKNDNPTDVEMKNAIDKFNSIVENGKKITYNDSNISTQYNNMKRQYKTIVLKYYEYIQFKKAIFKCVDSSGNSGITYDNVTGRVSSLSFEWTGDIK